MISEYCLKAEPIIQPTDEIGRAPVTQEGVDRENAKMYCCPQYGHQNDPACR